MHYYPHHGRSGQCTAPLGKHPRRKHLAYRVKNELQGSPLPTANQWHGAGHGCHEEDIAFTRKLRHIKHRLAQMIHIHAGLHFRRAIGLRDPLDHFLGHFGGGIANVNLSTNDVEGPSIQGDRLG